MSETNSAPRPVADWLTARRFTTLLAVFVLASWPQVFLGLQTFVFRDFGYYAYPAAYYLRESFWRGEIPLWNPLSYCGSPFLAQWNTQVLYPPTLFYELFPLSWALGVFCLLHLYLGGLGMFFLARRWAGDGLAAAVAGIAFAFSGLMINSLMWPGFIPGLGWMPWVVWLVERGWREGGRISVLAAIVGALQMLSGAVEVILLTWGLLGALWLAEFIGGGRPRGKILWRGSVMVVLVMGLSAAQLLPFFDLLKVSHRQGNFDAAMWPMPVTGWLNFLAPLFNTYRTYHGVFMQHGQYWTYSYYVGVFTVVLAGWAIWRGCDVGVRLLAALTLLCLVLALGEATPVYTWCRQHIGMIQLMRYPVKFVILPMLTLPLLAAIGMAIKSRSNPGATPGRNRSWWIIGLATVALMLGILYWSHRSPHEADNGSDLLMNGLARIFFFITILGVWLQAEKISTVNSRRLLQILLLVLVWLDVSHHAPQPQTVSRTVYEPGLPRSLPPPRVGESRAMLTLKAAAELGETYISKPADDYVSRRFALFSNCNLLDDLPKVDGFFPLQILEQDRVGQLLYGLDAPNYESEPLLDFLGASQITSETNDFHWLPRPNFMPMITGGQKPVFADDTNTLPVLRRPDFNPRTEVYLPLATKSLVMVTNGSPVKIAATHFAAQHLEATVTATAPALVVIAQTFYHPWHAYVDGQRVELLRANVGFQAVAVPAGTHELKLIYEDRRFVFGAIISLATLLVCLVAWWKLPKRAALNAVQVAEELLK
jgi:hypothetical protein